MLTSDLTEYSFQTIVKVRGRKVNKIKTKKQQIRMEDRRTERPPSPSASFMPPLHLRLPHASFILTPPHVTPPSASPLGISNPSCSSFLSLAWGVQRENNSLSLWFGVCKGRKISLCSSSLSGNRLIQKKKN